MKTRILDRSLYWEITVIAATAMLFAGIAMAEEPAEKRSSAISQGKGIERGQLTDGAIEFLEHDGLVTEGARSKPSRIGSQGNVQQKAAAAPAANTDFWFYDATVDLFSDLDFDGYYFGIDLTFDADTLYSSADVYAVIYLSYELGPWNEYAVTETFEINGSSGSDEYTVQSELVSGYPTGDYDILIELFDAYNDEFVASIGPEETSELAYLPLEDAGRDAPIETQVVINHGSGGGSLGLFGLLALGLIVARRRA